MVMQSEAERTAVSAPEKQPLQPESGETSTPKMISEAEHRKILTDALNAARGEDGRKHKVALAAVERRAQQQSEASLAELREENQKLQQALD